MVAIVENWAVIIGTVMGIVHGGMAPDTAGLDVRIERIEAVHGYPMLLTQKPGDRITISVPDDKVDDGLLNAPIEVRVRRGRDPSVVFAAPDWSPGPR